MAGAWRVILDKTLYLAERFSEALCWPYLGFFILAASSDLCGPSRLHLCVFLGMHMCLSVVEITSARAFVSASRGLCLRLPPTGPPAVLHPARSHVGAAGRNRRQACVRAEQQQPRPPSGAVFTCHDAVCSMSPSAAQNVPMSFYWYDIERSCDVFTHDVCIPCERSLHNTPVSEANVTRAKPSTSRPSTATSTWWTFFPRRLVRRLCGHEHSRPSWLMCTDIPSTHRVAHRTNAQRN
jgi:hypothetical protein